MTAAPQFRRLKPRTGAPVSFSIDGVPVQARQGDLLITAILLNAPALRRFEFGDGHRAGFCFMGACQDCWVTLAGGQRVRACTTSVEEGMAVLVDGAAHG